MRANKRLMFIAVMVIIMLSLCINYTYSQLSPTKRRELVTAYMNGCYRALQLEIEEIKRLQNDKGVLKHNVKRAGGRYANLIDIMNSTTFSENKGSREYREHKVIEGNQKY